MAINPYELDECMLRGRVPLDRLKAKLEDKSVYKSSSQRYVFAYNGYCNDAIFCLLERTKLADNQKYKPVSEMSITGGSLITNIGIKFLTKLQTGVLSYTKFNLDCCTQLSDDDLALLLQISKTISMVGTSIRHLSDPDGPDYKINTEGCKVLTGKGNLVDLNNSHVIVIPHKTVTKGLTQYLKTGQAAESTQSFHHEEDLTVSDWKVTFTEMKLDHPLFDMIITTHVVQAIITFEAGRGSVDEIKKHVADSIAKVIIKNNFTAVYPDNKQEEVEKKEEEKSDTEKSMVVEEKAKEPEEAKRAFRECEFILVQIGTDQKQLEALQTWLIEGNIFQPILEQIDKSSENHENNLIDLDLSRQREYADVCAARLKLDTFNTVKEDCVHWLSVDLASSQSGSAIKEKMKEILDCRRHHQQLRYKIAEKFVKAVKDVLEIVKKHEILNMSGGLVEKLEINGDEFLQIARLLHEQGKLVIMELCTKTLIADLSYLSKLVDQMQELRSSKKGTALSGCSPAIEANKSDLYVDEKAGAIFGSTLSEKSLKNHLLEDFLGLVELAVLRKESKDSQFIYFDLYNVTKSPKPIDDFYNKERPANFVMMEKTYRFIYPVAKEVMSSLVSGAAKYGRTLLMSEKGAVFQMGCVQTVIRASNWSNDYREVNIQSKCYLPEQKSEAVNEDTEFYVKEHIWSIFCLYTDIMDKIVKQRHLVCATITDAPKGLVNSSFGCKHAWTKMKGPIKQSVCTMCNKCCGQGRNCLYNGIMGDNLRECLCKTEISGCEDCGICVDCSTELWEIRSYLRPMPITANRSTKVYSSTHAEALYDQVPMDPQCYSEFEYTMTNAGEVGFYLTEVEDATIVTLFPGVPFASSEMEPLNKFKELAKNENFDPVYKVKNGDTIKFRITDPSKVILKETDYAVSNEIKQSRTVYYSYYIRELKISHETGLLCFDSRSTSIPVGQFVGPEPFSEKFTKFSFQIMRTGKSKAIGIGVGPKTYGANRMPGWDGYSYGYHCDDGGIYMEKGSSDKKSYNRQCTVGDIMSVYCSPEEKIIRFYKNEQLVYVVEEDAIRVPQSGFHPIVTLHSVGECVKLLEKNVWTPTPGNIVQSNSEKSFDTYKYGNLWISPRKNLQLRLKDKTAYLTGWVILHNPTKSIIGYKLSKGPSAGCATAEGGYIDPHESTPLHFCRRIEEDDDLIIEWLTIDVPKKYSSEDIKKMFEAAPDNKKYSHKIKMVMVGNTKVTETLPLFDEAEVKDGYKLDIIKNSTLINSYLIKKGRYLIDSRKYGSDPLYTLKRPKCPGFLYPAELKKGLKVITCTKSADNPVNARFAEKAISKIDERGRIIFILDEDETGSDVTCTMVTAEDDKLLDQLKKEKLENARVFMFSGSEDLKLVEKTYTPAPPYLISKESAKILRLHESKWMTWALQTHSACYHVISRPTIQEKIITSHSRNLLQWSSNKNLDKQMPYVHVYLPSNLGDTCLRFPRVTSMFNDVDVHKLCCIHDDKSYLPKGGAFLKVIRFPQRSGASIKLNTVYDSELIQAVHVQDEDSQKTFKLNQPRQTSIHFMDFPGTQPSSPVPVDYSYGNMYQAWNYIALLAHRLKLPSMGVLKERTGFLKSITNEQIETLLYQLLQSYASLCGIYATQHGGLSNQVAPPDLVDWVAELFSDGTTIKDINEEIQTEDKGFVKIGDILACKGHAMGRADHIQLPKYSLDSGLYKPYNTIVDTIRVQSQSLSAPVPKDLFEVFRNLRIMSIVDIDLKDVQFPQGIASCKSLEVIIWSNIKNLTKLPNDLLCGPNLTTVYIHHCPVTTLDLKWPKNSKMTSLTLKGLLIDSIPASIGNLEGLKDLNLNYNPLTTLPQEMDKLVKLKHLSVKGIPWIHLDGNAEQLSKVMFNNWQKENPYVMNYLQKSSVDKLFALHDENSTDVLEKMELVKLNTHLLFNIPRLGLKSAADKDYGGIPQGIFKLKSLETLDLSYTAITCIPRAAREIINLRTLHIEHCPLLESIDSNVGLLPNIKAINLHGCPSLDSPPQDIVGRGFQAIVSYLQKMEGGFTECHRTKLMFIGLGQAGKTTLLKALQSSNKKYSGGVSRLTDGIEIKEWDVPVTHMGEQFQIKYSCWDFAGQTVYYNTHQFFLSKQAVYMLLWNMRMGFEHAGLDFWLSSIVCHCPDTPVIVVGTQLDQIPMPDIREDELMKKYPQIKKFCYVSSTAGTNVKELEEALIDVTLNYCPQMTMKIPLLWLDLEEKFIIARTKHKLNILDWNRVLEFAHETGISDEQDVKLAIQFLGDLGALQYFDTEVLNNKVVINPQWIVDVMAKVVSVNEKSIRLHRGRFYHSAIPEVWKNYDPSLHGWLLKLTEAFDLTFPVPAQLEEGKFNIVPCLLPEKEPANLPWPYLSEEDGNAESKIDYKFTYLPTGLFNRAQARMFSQGFTMNEEFLNLMWKRGSILQKNGHYALVKQTSDYELTVIVQGPRPKNVLDLIHETMVTLIKDSFEGVDYDFYIPCPDCVEKKASKDPYTFKAELINRAHNVNAPFLQCTKYFHTVSIGELQNNLPDNKDTEFDIQIQQSISTLQEISTNMAKDVAILYCAEDIPTDKKDIHPKDIYLDLKKAGFSCWYPDDISKVSNLEMTMEIKNATVLVVCMTNNFVADPVCHNMFLYATDQLEKPFSVAVIDESLDWQQSDIGCKIGIPKMAMIKNKERYPKQILNLIDIVRSYKDEITKGVVEHPPVFISYCWANSKEACTVGTTVPTSGSLGFGDPRAIKKHLEKNNIRCWLDIEQMGKRGLYQDITVGLQNSKVLVLCVSDEYLQSDACMMEARFGAYNLQMPLVVCVVGTGKAWKMSEVSLMISKQGDSAVVVKLQKKESGLYDKVLEHVKEFLSRPESTKQRKIREKLAKIQEKKEKLAQEDIEKQLKQQGDNKFSFQEEVELIQRKFLRHITMMVRGEQFEQELPKLMVFDFVSKDPSIDVPQQPVNIMGSQASLGGGDMSSFSSFGFKARKRRQSVAIKKHDSSGWQHEDFCIKILCEDEQGWHLVGESLSLLSFRKEEVHKMLKDAAPYLARLYVILKQSSVTMSCLNNSPTAERFMDFIRKEGIETKNLSEAYKTIHKVVAEHSNQENFTSHLDRCYLQTGKISWLCPLHQNKAGITQLSSGAVVGTSSHLLEETDILMGEYLPYSPGYQLWKGGHPVLTKRTSNRILKRDSTVREFRAEDLPVVTESKGDNQPVVNESSNNKPDISPSTNKNSQSVSNTNSTAVKTIPEQGTPKSTVNSKDSSQKSTVNSDQSSPEVSNPTPVSNTPDKSTTEKTPVSVTDNAASNQEKPNEIAQTTRNSQNVANNDQQTNKVINQQNTQKPTNQQTTLNPSNQQMISKPANQQTTPNPSNQQMISKPANQQTTPNPSNQQMISKPANQQTTPANEKSKACSVM